MISKLSDARKLKELAKFYAEIEPIDYKNVSTVAVNLKIWVGALLKYIECYRFVKPKMESLDSATKELATVEADLFEKSKFLNAKLDELKKLQQSFENAKNQLKELSDSIENISVKQKRAVRLVDGLKSEGIRWKENIGLLEKEEKNLIANVVISASIVSYSGPFTIEYKEEFTKSVVDYVKEVGINYNPTEKFSLQEMLSDPLSIREWNYAGLPADDLSIDNAIITVRSKRWPLIIDPQMQANKWIKNYYKNSGIKIFKMSDKTLFNRLKDCITGGYPVLVENVEQTIESSLEPILQKQVYKQGAVYYIAMGGNEKPLQFSNQFKLFLTSKLSNPHYLPEISIKVTLINFAVTLKGLEDQLLVDVVKNERPDLESQRDSLILNINENKKAIKDLEHQILNMVKDASTEILDNDILVNKLDQSKEQSAIISADLEKAEKTATTINKERRGYKPIAVRGSILYFVISSLANIDSMYNYSLEYFTKIFNQRLERSEQSDVVSKRIEILINDITISFYEKISRGLFEKDKLLYSFLILSNLLMNDKQISIFEWTFFLKGTGLPKVELTEEEFNNKFYQYFTTYQTYRTFISIKDLSLGFKNIEEDLKNMKNEDLFIIHEFLISETPYEVRLPDILEKAMSDYYRLCLVKMLREEKLIFAIKSFIEKSMGKRYVESPPFSVAAAFNDSLKTTPLIFILSPGANPVNYLRLYSKEKKIPMMNISLGQGQGIIAKNAIMNAKDKGEWVCLENCHLSKSWMPALEELLEEVNENEEDIENNYRLWLTSMPTPNFPVSILQNGIKLTNEPPKGLKANLKGTYNNLKEEDFINSSKPLELHKITFSLAFFHAVILERRKYGPLGWNIPYEWMNSDFEASKLHVKMYIEEYEEVPFQILQFLIGVINYGGRVTDDKDCKLISAILNKYVNDLVIDDLYKFDENGRYYAPNMEGEVPECLSRINEYLETLPLDDPPDVFGLNYNANITLQNKMVKDFMEPLIAIQPRTAGSAIKKPDDIVLELRDELFVNFSKIKKLDLLKGNADSIYDNGDKTKKSPLGNFLIQECDKFNNLIGIIHTSLINLEKAVKGTIVMSPDIENIYNSFLGSNVPKLWEDNAYLSLKPIASWMMDFVERILFMEKWLYEGKLYCYWLSAFFFPQGKI
jgi:dynein heavy chain